MTPTDKPDATEAAERVRELTATNPIFANFMADTSFDSADEMLRFIKWFDEPGRVPSGWDVTRYARAQMALAYAEQSAEIAELRAKLETSNACIPDTCPITGLPFFMAIPWDVGEGVVATYGGPYDSYTIPELCDPQRPESPGEMSRRRYDHDAGCWKDWEILDERLVSEQEHLMPLWEQENELKELRAKLAKYDDATPIDEVWCRENGFETAPNPDYLRRELHRDTDTITHVWFNMRRKMIGVSDWESQVDLPSIATRGQLRNLLDGLGVRA